MNPTTATIESLEPRTLLSAGDLDPTFGAHGVVVFPDIVAPVVGLATQSDGKFVLANHTTVYRFRADGTLDRSFGHRGHVTPGFTLYGLGIDHSGRIAVGGGTDDFKWAAARYKPDGTPDTAFNGTGQIITHVNGNNDERATVMALQPDGKIIVGGTQFNGNNDEALGFDYNAVAVRFNVNGAVDTSFGNGGEAFDFGGVNVFSTVNAIALSPAGDVALAGRFDGGQSIHDKIFEVVNSSGLSIARTPVGEDPGFYSSYRAAAFRPDGVRVLADEDEGNSDLFFNNQRIPIFFDPLKASTPSDEKINAIVTTADNKTLIAGATHGLGLIRFNPNGTPDATFGFGGTANILINRKKAQWIDKLALLPNGDYLAAGTLGASIADGRDNGAVFVTHITGGAHTVGALPPRAQITFPGPPYTGASTYTFTITYAAEESIDPATLDGRDIRVIGPGGYSVLARLIQNDSTNAGQQRFATYEIDAPGGTWNRADNGHYIVYLRPNQVSDNRGRPCPAQILGGFKVHIPRTTAATPAIARAITQPQISRKRNDLFDA
ncbi:MAG: uncharacterized protein JWN40_831 [Phycisphaerales bacterium]|nr:uncharacterized protein [Phycisphaerales bacterium]